MDHKPLSKLFGNMNLEEIPNMTFFWLKQRTLLWYFQIIHLLGKTNFTADAASHHAYPTLDKSDLSKECMLKFTIATAIPNDTQKLTSITWELLIVETHKNGNFKTFQGTIYNGFPKLHWIISLTAPY